MSSINRISFIRDHKFTTSLACKYAACVYYCLPGCGVCLVVGFSGGFSEQQLGFENMLGVRVRVCMQKVCCTVAEVGQRLEGSSYCVC